MGKGTENKPRRGKSKFHFSPRVAGNTLWSVEAAWELKWLLFILMHLSWTTRKPKANTNTPLLPCFCQAAQLLLQDTRCARAGLRGETLTPGKWEDWQHLNCLTGLHGSSLYKKGGYELPLGWGEADFSRPLWSLTVRGTENKSAQLMRNCWLGQCFLEPISHQILPSTCCWAVCHLFPGTLSLFCQFPKFIFPHSPKGGCLFKSKSQENCWFSTSLQDEAKREMLRVFCKFPWILPPSPPFLCPVLLLKRGDSDQVPAEGAGKLGRYSVGQGPARTRWEGREGHLSSMSLLLQSCNT